MFEIGIVDDAVLVGFVHQCLNGDAVVALQASQFFEGEGLAIVAQPCVQHRNGDEHLAGEGIAEVFDVGPDFEMEDEMCQL